MNIDRSRRAYSKVDTGHAVENNENVSIRQILEAKIDSN